MKVSLMNPISHRWFALAFLFSVFASNVYAGRELVISPYRQWGSNTCWAACSYMILNAYRFTGIGSDEMIIRKWAFPPSGPDVTNQMSGTTVATDKVLEHFGPIYSTFTPFNSATGGGNISQSDLTKEIDAGRPALSGRLIADGTTTGRKHMLLIIGYTGSGGSNAGSVIYNDPSTGQRTVQIYSEFVRLGNSYQWIESLRLTTPSRTPISTGFNDWVRIQPGGTEVITPATSALMYRADYYSGSTPICYPTKWTWKLIFPHSGGDCIANSWVSPSTLTYSIWNISGFSLPTGYQWKYNFDGKIPGRVEVVVDDRDGLGGQVTSHADAINVLFVPNSLYPGVLVFENRTISNTQPDAKAHELLAIQNDQFLAGCNISLKSGEQIEINDGVNIDAGSITNFTIDPALR